MSILDYFRIQNRETKVKAKFLCDSFSKTKLRTACRIATDDTFSDIALACALEMGSPKEVTEYLANLHALLVEIDNQLNSKEKIEI